MTNTIGWTMTSEELEGYTTKTKLEILERKLQRANDRIKLLEDEIDTLNATLLDVIIRERGTDGQIQELLRDLCKANNLIAKLRFPKLAS